MSDLHADIAVPSIETENGSTLNNTKNGIVNNTSAAADAVKNHPITQSFANGPVADNIKDQHAKTQNELSNLAASRQTPAAPAATGQPLTHYHSFFGSLLSWENPRASGIAYASVVLFIFAARYLDIIRYTFKVSYMILGITVLAEAVGKALLSTGLTSQIRPKKYYTVSKETLNALIGDVHELINFFVIEAQQIIFAENLFMSSAAFLGAFFSYYLIKVVPFWGLSLISTSILFLAPLIYKTNQELIDHHISNATKVINDQTEQVKALASQHAAQATASTKSLVGDYSAKAQEMIGNARGRSVSPTLSSKPAKTEAEVKKENVPSYKAEDFPAAPKEEFKSAAGLKTEEEPLIAT
ncbi:hypothetical protein EG329_013896 [Mollisiaceae sp. DMI_Dod_QoI]|nr:hypothetical protein EG329_013896 [Helotiales sp. DMI_Dod_QoI]